MGFGQYYSYSAKFIGYRADWQKAICTEEKVLSGTNDRQTWKQIFGKYLPTIHNLSVLTFWGAEQSDKYVAVFLIC